MMRVVLYFLQRFEQIVHNSGYILQKDNYLVYPGIKEVNLNFQTTNMKFDNQQHNILKGYNMLLYFAGTMIMYEPSEECITDFWKNGVVRNLPVSSSNPNFAMAASQLRESYNDENFCGKNLVKDYFRLFGRPELALAPAYESHYYNNVSNIPANSATSTVSEFYNSYGWESKFRGIVSDDHLALEILFLTRLIDNYLEMDDKACQREMKIEIRRFIEYHLFTWISDWNRSVQLNSETLAFKGIGNLILACIEDIYQLLEQKTSTVFSLLNSKN
jgi:TorA maturation chaperone TorD